MLGVGLLMVTICQGISFVHHMATVVTSTSILSSEKIQNGDHLVPVYQVVMENGS